MPKNIYEFKADVRGGRGKCQWCSISKIEINNSKLNIDNKIYKSKDMFNSLKNCSGNYDIDEIKSIKKSSKQLWGLIFILWDLMMFYCIIYCLINNSVSGLGAVILSCIIVTLCFRIKTIKITFKSTKSIHIPISSFFGRYISIDYKEGINEFLNAINDDVKFIKNM